jgi:ABC-2 type transport system permease protein
VSAALATVGLGARLAVAWRLDALTRFVGGAGVLLLNGHLWRTVAEGGAVVPGRTSAELVSYVVVAWVVASVARSDVDRELGERTRTGKILTDLIRPGDLQLHLWLREVGRAAAGLVLAALPLAVVGGLLFPVSLAVSVPGDLVMFGVSVALAHAVAVGLATAVGAVGLRLGRGDGLVHLKAVLVALLSGSVIPLDVYPESVARVLRVLPFAAMADAPADLLVHGRGWAEALPLLAVQGGWALGLAVIARALLAWARRSPAVRGG